METCKTCRWWERNTEVLGTCKGPHVAEDSETPNNMISVRITATDSGLCSMRTGPYFGCIFHEPHPKG
jgi:hypothetical protein